MSSPTPESRSTPAQRVCATCGGPLANVMGAQCPRCLLNLGSTLGFTDEADASEALLDPFQVRTFGDYELLEEIARGGMGVVYRARQISLGREVAVKMILAGELASKGSLQLFQREAHAAANLHHPNIVPVFEIGEHQTQHYFTMRFVPGGQTIADWAVTRRTDFRAIALVVAQVARAVAHAHSHGVLHRDLKPSNILWDAQAGPQVTDFGLAKLMDAPGTTATLNAKALGSPSYMAPEQAEGRLAEITTATDVYGLGAVLYELLSGRAPFSGGSIVETMRRVAEDAPEPLPQVPKDLRTICIQCLAKQPEDRYATAAALAEDLEHFARGEPVSAVPLNTAQTLWRWAKRHPLVASLALLSIVSLLTGVVGITWQWRQAELARRGESAALQKATTTVVDLHTHAAARETDFTRAALWFAQAAAASPGAAQRAENLARHAVWQRESHAAVRAFQSHVGPVQELSWNNTQTALLGRTTNRAAIWNVDAEARWGADDLGELENAAWANRSSWVAIAATGLVRLVEYPSGRELARTSFQGTAPRLAVSRDDRWVLVGGEQSILWDTLDGSVRRLPATPAPPRLVEFSRNGQLVMLCFESSVGVCAVDAPESFLFPPVVCRMPTRPGFLNNDAFYTCVVNNEIAVIEARSGESLERHVNDTRWESTPRFASPDGRYIVPAWAPMLERGQGFKTFPVTPNGIVGGEFSRDGSWLITAGYDSVLRRWPLPKGEPQEAIGWHQEVVLAAAISPDQQFIASAQGGGGLIKVWRLARPPGAREIKMGGDSSVRLSADGQLLLPNGGTYENHRLTRTRVFSTETAQPLGPEIDPGGLILDADLSPDGKWIVVACSTTDGRANHHFLETAGRGNLQIWDWRNGTPLGEPIETPSEPRGVAIHPSGRWVAAYAAGGELTELEVAIQQLRVLRPATRIHAAAYLNQNGRCRYSPDGRWIIGWGMRDEPIFWDREAGKAIAAPFDFGAWINDVDFRDNLMGTVSWQSGIEFHTWPGLARAAAPERDNDRLHLGRFSPEGDSFLTLGRGQVAHLWDWRTGRLKIPALRHEGEIYSGVFMPGTDCIVTGGLDNQIRFWDRRSGLPMRPPISTSHAILDLAVTPDGRTLVRGSHRSGFIKLYDLSELLPKSTLHVEDALLIAEIDAAAEIVNGGVEPLNAAAWLAKWQQFRAKHPQWHRW